MCWMKLQGLSRLTWSLYEYYSLTSSDHISFICILHLTTAWRPNNIRSESLSHLDSATLRMRKKTNNKTTFIVCAGDLTARHISSHTHMQRQETCSWQNKIVYKNRRINLFRPFHAHSREFGTNATFVFIITHVCCVLFVVWWILFIDLPYSNRFSCSIKNAMSSR